jgi:hypothetical protein
MAGGRGPAIKAGLTITLSATSISLWRRGHHKRALVVSLVPAGLTTAVAIHNGRVGR